MKNLKKLLGLMVISGFAFGFSGVVNAATVALGTSTLVVPDGTTSTYDTTGTGTSNITYKYTGDITLQLQEAGQAGTSSAGRPAGFGWIGVQVTAPSDLNDNAKYTWTRTDGTKDSGYFRNVLDQTGTDVVTFWNKVSAEMIKEGKDVSGVIALDWNNDGTVDQTVTVIIPTSKVVLQDDNGKEVYPKLDSSKTATVTTTSDAALAHNTAEATVNAKDPSHVIVTYTELELTKVAEDRALGRNAGWYAGLKITAPSDVSTPVSFRYQKDGKLVEDTITADEDGAYYIWTNLTEDMISDTFTRDYEFDWDGDGYYEQTITMIVEPSVVTLYDGDKVVYEYTEPTVTPEQQPADTQKPADTNTDKKPAADNTASKNPQTYDAGIMGSLVLVLSSIGTLGYASKKVLSK